MVSRINSLSRKRKRLALVAVDVVLLPLALWLAFFLRLGEPWPYELADNWWILIAAPVVAIPVFIQQGLYRAVVRYMGDKALFTIARAVLIGTLLLLALVVFTHAQGLPRSSFFIYAGLALLMVGGSRMVLRAYIDVLLEGAEKKELVGIYGAGRAGVQLAKALLAGNQYQPVFFVDDNKELQKTELFGIRVFSPDKIDLLVDNLEVEQILLAIPSASHQRRKEILERLEPLPVQIKTLPGIEDIATGKVRVEDVREVDIEDLLGRDPIPPIEDLLYQCIQNKSVLVTGAGGSIGSELCRQIAALKPACLVLFERHEFNLYQTERELQKSYPELIIVPVLGSVNHQSLLTRVMKKYSVNTVYHAAAYKHVPLVEANLFEGIYNNVFGTLNSAQTAEKCGVETFILISTDKAVRPTNIMGASKRVAELVLQGLSEGGSKTKFTMVRFGNVLGSSGSVVPLFREQIKNGGPVTVTHPDVTRYFMTIPEAAQLVLQAGAMGEGGDVFVLDMGETVKIADLAKKMIHLSGYVVKEQGHPDGDIEVTFTGLRPGEKLYEELLIGSDVQPTAHKRIMRTKENFLPYNQLLDVLNALKDACDSHDEDKVVSILGDIVAGYRCSNSEVDEESSKVILA